MQLFQASLREYQLVLSGGGEAAHALAALGGADGGDKLEAQHADERVETECARYIARHAAPELRNNASYSEVFYY
jgi:hypothetical protein